MKIINPLRGFELIVLGISISTSVHAAQHITHNGTNVSFVGPQETVTYSGVYSVSSPQTGNETGIGLRVHYNSSLLTPTGNQRYSTSAQPEGEITDDVENYDGDPLTDKYFILAWADVEAQWPGSNALPLNLFEAQFTTVTGFNQTTNIRITKTDTAHSAPLLASSLVVCAKPTISLSDIVSSYPDNVILEKDAGSAKFTIASDIPTCSYVELNYTLSGTATPDTDYSISPKTPASYDSELPETTSIHFNAIDDNELELDETVTLTLEKGENYFLGSPTSATLTIQSDDNGAINNLPSNLPEVNLSTSKIHVTEGSSGSLIIYATRSDQDLSQPLEVFFQLGGSASAGDDYQPFPSSITIPAGKSQSFATLVLKDDAITESQEVITVSIAANAQYQKGSSNTLRLTIADDEVSQNTNLAIERHMASSTSKPIPTLNEWMLLLMSLLMGSLALINLITTRKGNT